MLSEQAQVIERYPDHHFRTEIPNIIYELGLDVYERDMYCILKKIAGDYGECWRSKRTLAECCGIGQTKLREVIKRLSEPFELLDNKPLIEIIRRKNVDGSDQSSLIIICPIWDVNGRYFRKIHSKSKKCLPCSPKEEGGLRDEKTQSSPEVAKEEPLLRISQLEEQIEPVVIFQEQEKRKLLGEYKLLDQTMRLLLPFELERIKDALEAYGQWKEKNPNPSSPDAMILTLVRSGARKNGNDKDLKLQFLSSIKHLDGKIINNVSISVGMDYISFSSGCSHRHFDLSEKNFIVEVEKYIEELNKNAKKKGKI